MNDNLIHIQYSLEHNELKDVKDGAYPIKGVIFVGDNNKEISYTTSKKVTIKSELIAIHTLEEAFKEFLHKSIELDNKNKRQCFFMESCEFETETETIQVHWGT